MITSFSDPEVEQGGLIRNTVVADLTVPPTETHNFYILNFYGTGSDMNAILSSVVVVDYTTTGPIWSGEYEYWLDSFIPLNAPLGTYSCVTIIAEDFDGVTITDIYDAKIDSNILTIVKGLTASITSTSFMRVTF